MCNTHTLVRGTRAEIEAEAREIIDLGATAASSSAPTPSARRSRWKTTSRTTSSAGSTAISRRVRALRRGSGYVAWRRGSVACRHAAFPRVGMVSFSTHAHPTPGVVRACHTMHARSFDVPSCQVYDREPKRRVRAAFCPAWSL